MSFDFRRFFDRQSIRYVTEGMNVAAGNINISCPFCNREGNPDPSEHMGVHTRTGYWACWRNKRKHSGKRPHRLIMALLRCSYEQAQLIVESGIYLDGDFIPNFSPVKKQREVRKRKLDLPESFRPIKPYGSGRRAFKYLMNRDYEQTEVMDLVGRFNLRYESASSSPWRERVIIPVYNETGLVTWTARGISSSAMPRYRTLTVDPDKAKREGTPVAAERTSECLFDHQALLEARNYRGLIVVEGPFDAMRLTFFLERERYLATSLFTNSMSTAQLAKLSVVRRNFKRLYVLLDQEAEAQTVQVLTMLSPFSPRLLSLPNRVKDPALLTRSQAYDVIRLAA